MQGERIREDRAEGQAPRSTRPWLRFLPIAFLGAGAAVAALRYGDYLSFGTLAENHQALLAWRDANPVLAAAAYVGVYIALVAFSAPGAVWVTIAGGMLFGTAEGAVLTVAAATTGAVLIFLAARSSLGHLLHARAGPWLRRVDEEFARGEVSFLLIMRLVPAMPFFVANLLPAFLNARFVHYLWTTFVGIAPATVVFTSVGAGFGSEIAAGEPPDLGVIFEAHILGPLLGLAALAALPLAIRWLRARRR